MDIAAAGIAMLYLIFIVAGAALALAALIWLFGDAPDEGAGSGRQPVEDSPGTDRFAAPRKTAAPSGPERSEGKAA